MIDTMLKDLLPEEISDEAAHHLVEFISTLALTLEDHYFTQLRRHYLKENGLKLS